MKKISAMFLAAAVFSAALTGCGANETVVPTQQPQSSAESQRETETETETQSNSGQLTLEDIRQLNGGDIRYSTDGQGKITFLAGKFYDGKIEDGEDVLRALEGVSALIGADDNVAFQKGDAVVDDNGYTYYTLQQWHGDTEVVGSIVKIIVDPDKEAAAISSSVQPGVDAGTDLVISPEEAVEAARTHLAQTMPETAYTFYPEQVDKTTIPYAENMEEDTTKLYNVYVVYTDNPDAAAEETDFPYMAHYISSQGTYLYETPIFRMSSKEAEFRRRFPENF